MSQENPLYKPIVKAMAERTPEELAHGWLRYEALRKLHPRAFKQLCEKNLDGYRFDALVDELLIPM